jgi:hypothetical protein
MEERDKNGKRRKKGMNLIIKYEETRKGKKKRQERVQTRKYKQEKLRKKETKEQSGSLAELYGTVCLFYRIFLQLCISS